MSMGTSGDIQWKTEHNDPRPLLLVKLFVYVTQMLQ